MPVICFLIAYIFVIMSLLILGLKNERDGLKQLDAKNRQIQKLLDEQNARLWEYFFRK
jgi:hypothetical protein